MLRNRKTHETFTYEQGTLKSTSLFAKKVDAFQFNNFINELICKLPENISTNDRQKIIFNLRKAYSESDALKEIDKNPEKFKQLMAEIKNQGGTKSDSTSLSSFVKTIASSFINAQLNSIFPGLSLLFGAAAANSYMYHEGMPQGGEDLCEKALGECIQGYLAEMDETWSAQIARDFTGNTNDSTSCITQNDLETMIRRGFQPNNDTVNCTLTNIVEPTGKSAVTATNLDQIGCNLMQDSLTGITTNCGLTPPQPSLNKNLLALGVVGGMVGLIAIVYVAHKCWTMSRQDREYERLSINVV